jgi:hypothetical protein
LHTAEAEAAEPFQSAPPPSLLGSIIKHILGSGGDILGVIDNVANLKSAFKVIKNIDNWADLGNALKSWKSLGQISDELFSTLTLQGSKLGNAGTVLGMIGAMMEGYEDWQKGEGLTTIAISETSEFVLDTALHVAMYANPVTGSIMAVYDVAQFAAPLFGIDPESFDVVDDVTDYVGDVIAQPGMLIDDIGNAMDVVGDFSSGLIDNAGDALSSAWKSIF